MKYYAKVNTPGAYMAQPDEVTDISQFGAGWVMCPVKPDGLFVFDGAKWVPFTPTQETHDAVVAGLVRVLNNKLSAACDGIVSQLTTGYTQADIASWPVKQSIVAKHAASKTNAEFIDAITTHEHSYLMTAGLLTNNEPNDAFGVFVSKVADKVDAMTVAVGAADRKRAAGKAYIGAVDFATLDVFTESNVTALLDGLDKAIV